METKDQILSSFKDKLDLFSVSYENKEIESQLVFSWDKPSLLIPLNNMVFVDSGLQEAVSGPHSPVLNEQGNQNASNGSNFIAAFEYNPLWHETQGTATENPIPVPLSSSYQPDYNMYMPHYEATAGTVGPYDSFSNLDLTNFQPTDAAHTSVFYEAAVDGPFAKAAGLPKDIPPLGYFPYEGGVFGLSVTEPTEIFTGTDRTTEFSAPPVVAMSSTVSLIPPLADSEDYVYNSNKFDETSGTGPFTFVLGDIISRDTDPEHTTLSIGSLTTPTFTLSDPSTITLTPVLGSLPAGVFAEYQFTYQGTQETLIIDQNGTLSLETPSRDLFGSLERGETATFSFNRTDIDNDHLSSNVANVKITIDGENVPVANPDSVTLSETQVTGDQVSLLNILNNDTDGFGSRPLSVADIADPSLTIAGSSVSLTLVGSLPAGLFAEYAFNYNGQTADLTIGKNGSVDIVQLGGQDIFANLIQGQQADFSFQYQNTDGIDLSNAATVTVTIDGVHSAPVAVPDTYTLDAGHVDSGISSGGDLIGNILSNDSDPQNTSLAVQSITDPTLNGTPLIVLTPLSTNIAEYQFTYQGNTGTLEINQDGQVSIESADSTLFQPVPWDESGAVFSFNYTDIDGDGILSNSANVSITINGDINITDASNLASTTEPESYQFQSPDTASQILADLVEGQNLNNAHPGLVDGMGLISLPNGGDVNVSFYGSDTGFANTLGWYEVNSAGQITDVQIIPQFDNLHNPNLTGGTLSDVTAGTNVDLGTLPEGTQVGFFLLPNGWNENSHPNPHPGASFNPSLPIYI